MPATTIEIPVCESAMPTLDETKALLEHYAERGALISFRYRPQLPRPTSPSAQRQREDTAIISPPDRARGFLEPGCVWLPSTGHYCVRFRSMDRRKLLRRPDGYYAAYSMEKGAYLWRTFRFAGINLRSVRVAIPHHGWTRIFPNAEY